MIRFCVINYHEGNLANQIVLVFGVGGKHDPVIGFEERPVLRG